MHQSQQKPPPRCYSLVHPSYTSCWLVTSLQVRSGACRSTVPSALADMVGQKRSSRDSSGRTEPCGPRRSAGAMSLESASAPGTARRTPAPRGASRHPTHREWKPVTLYTSSTTWHRGLLGKPTNSTVDRCPVASVALLLSDAFFSGTDGSEVMGVSHLDRGDLTHSPHFPVCGRVNHSTEFRQ